MFNPPGPFSRNRLFEWITTGMLLGIAVVLALSTNALEFRLLVNLGIGHDGADAGG